MSWKFVFDATRFKGGTLEEAVGTAMKYFYDFVLFNDLVYFVVGNSRNKTYFLTSLQRKDLI